MSALSKYTKFWNDVDLCHVSPNENGIDDEYAVAVEITMMGLVSKASAKNVVADVVDYYGVVLSDEDINIIITNLETTHNES